MKLSKLHIKTLRPGPLTPINCLVLLDGEPMKGVTKLSLCLDADNNAIARVHMEMVADVELEGDVELFLETPNEPEKA